MRASSSIVTDSGWRQCTILPRNTLAIIESGPASLSRASSPSPSPRNEEAGPDYGQPRYYSIIYEPSHSRL